jgi:hypothetical protein
METTLEAQTAVEERTIRTEADYLRMAADRRERRGEPVTALLFRNEAWRMENA